jgi:hypothetical protein
MRVIGDIAKLLEIISIVSPQPICRADPDNSEGIPNNSGGYSRWLETLKPLNAQHGEQLVLCENGAGKLESKCVE